MKRRPRRDPDEDLLKLGALVEATDDTKSEANVRAGRRLLLQRLESSGTGPQRESQRGNYSGRVVAAAGLAAAAAAVLFTFVAHRSPRKSEPRAMGFTVATTMPGMPGAQVGALEKGQVGTKINQPATLAFSDGAVIRLLPETQARVLAVHERGARVFLESGAAEVSVVHRDNTEWLVEGGPYEVRVTGTKFLVRWEPSRAEFSITMHEGSVQVRGCGTAQMVTHHEAVTLHCAANAFAPVVAPEDASTASDAPAATTTTAHPTAEPHAIQHNPTATPPSTSVVVPLNAPSVQAAEDYREVMARGDYPAAYALVASDFGPRVSRCAPEECRALADLARLTGHASEAKSAYRFSLRAQGSPRDRSLSDFYLGRYAHEGGELGAAESFFRECLDLEPAGPFAREALGRLLEITSARGPSPATEKLARDYLSRFPNGPHAAKARAAIP